MKKFIYYLLSFICFVIVASPNVFGTEYSNEVSVILTTTEKIKKEYEHSDLDDYVIYELFSVDPDKEYLKGSFYHIYTATFLNKEMAIIKLNKLLIDLEQTIKNSDETLAVDELLRHQVVSLAESLRVLDYMYPEETTDLAQVRSDALAILKRGYNRYTEIKARFDEHLKSRDREAETPENHLMRNLTLLAADGEAIIQFATAYEEENDAVSWTKRKEACGATARALLYYFEHQDLLGRPLKSAVEHPTQGIGRLIENLKKNRDQRGHGYLYFSDSAKLDHVFIIQQTAEGRYRVLQSYIDQYSLMADLTSQAESMDYDQVMEFCHKLEFLLSASGWNQQVEDVYKDLFLVSPKDYVRDEFGDDHSDFSFVELPYCLQ